MSDLVTIAPLTIHRLRLPRVRFPKLGVGAQIEVLFTFFGQAICMAYVEPFMIPRHKSAIFSEIDLEGRDPNW